MPEWATHGALAADAREHRQHADRHAAGSGRDPGPVQASAGEDGHGRAARRARSPTRRRGRSPCIAHERGKRSVAPGSRRWRCEDRPTWGACCAEDRDVDARRRDPIARPTDRDLDGDTLREECGVFGIFGHPDAAAITALGLHALQHRGQEAAGIVSFDGARLPSRAASSASSATTSPTRATIERLPGHAAIGHDRYSTTGETILRNVQPLFAELDGGGFAVAHNGNLTNGLTLRRELIARRRHLPVDLRHRGRSSTSCALAAATASSSTASSTRCAQIEGAYAFVGTDQQEADRRARPARHPAAGARRARRPLHPGLRDLRARHHRRPLRARHRERRGRGRSRTRASRVAPALPGAAGPALHLRIHLFRPARFGRERPQRLRGAQEHRRELAREAPAEADVVVPVPDSGVPAAIGFAQASGIPFELGIIRNHYVGRTFIEPTPVDPRTRRAHEALRQPRRDRGQARSCWSTIRIVRGTTSREDRAR